MSKLQVADEEYYLNSEYLLKLASHAKELFESSEPQEKRLLLKMTLQNLRLEGKTVRYDWINPFDKIAFYASRLAWLRQLEAVRTFYIDQIITPTLADEVDIAILNSCYKHNHLALESTIRS